MESRRRVISGMGMSGGSALDAIGYAWRGRMTGKKAHPSSSPAFKLSWADRTHDRVDHDNHPGYAICGCGQLFKMETV